MNKTGYLNNNELIYVQGNIALLKEFAPVYLKMVHDASLENTLVTLAKPDGGYRSRATSLDMRKNPRAHNITPGIVNAIPSDHEDGIAVDIANGLAWVIKNGKNYGLKRPLVKTDPNHFIWDRITFNNLNIENITSNMEENDMRFVYANNGGPQWTAINMTTGRAFRAFNQKDADTLSENIKMSADVVSAQTLANIIATAEFFSGHSIIYNK